MKKVKVILFAIVALAFLLRVFQLSKLPLYGDELTMVQDVYSILHTGKDVTGNSFPLTFTMGAGRPAGYVYFSIPFVAVFGPTAFGVRGLSILSGLGIIILLYFFGKKLFSERVGLVASFLAAISPWQLSLSRGGFEAHFALLVALLGAVLFLYAEEKPWRYLAAALCWGLTIHTYPTYKLTLPLFILLLIWFTGGFKKLFDKKVRRFIYLGVAVLAAAGLLTIGQTLYGGSEQRFFKINIFSRSDPLEEQQLIDKINIERSISRLPTKYSRFFHNRPVEYLMVLTKSYVENFSPQFLFLSGDGNPRHNMGQTGAFYLVEMPLVFLGLAFLILKKRTRLLAFLLAWILLVPVPAALLGPPHLLRSSFMLPPIVLISGVGFNYLWNLRVRGRALLALLAAVGFLQLLLVLEWIYYVSPYKFSEFWAYPAQRASEIVIEEASSYDYVFISSRIENSEYAYPVYAKVSAQDVIVQNQGRQKIGEYEFKKFGNVYIGDITPSRIANFLGNLKGKILFIGNYSSDREGLDPYQDIFAPDNIRILVVKRVNANQ
jgi:4-amino-4-deoxy-L-arabinose transferase-like glycosyltransferase